LRLGSHSVPRDGVAVIRLKIVFADLRLDQSEV
jgi:hypothetical protein